MTTGMTTTELRVRGMDCADCALTLEKALAGVAGVEEVQVNFSTGKMQLRGNPDLQQIQARVEALGYGLRDEDSPPEAPQERGFFAYMLAQGHTQRALLGILLLVASMSLLLLEALPLLRHSLEMAVILVVGLPIMRQGLQQLWLSRRITINLLMTIATIGALLIGEWEEAATVITLFAIGEALEGYSADRMRGAIGSLMQLAPAEALVLRPCTDCAEHLGQEGYTGGPCPWCDSHEQQVPVDEVAVGESLLVLPGSRIPLDGEVVAGQSAVDQAPITGESIPVEKGIGDAVFAGTVNGAGALQIRVSSRAQDSTLARIVQLVENAQAQKSPAERYVNRFAQFYTPAVVLGAALVALLPPLFLGAAWETWIYRALAMLVVACPCALVISTPVAVVSGMARAAQQGILIKGGEYLEGLSRVRVFAFDKTGTLTQGRPQVTQVYSVDCAGGPACDPCDNLLGMAGAVERQSEHPLGRAVVAAARERGVLERYGAAQAVTALPGRGVQGQLAAQTVTIGSHAFFDAQYPHAESLCSAASASEQAGQTVMLVADDRAVKGYIALADAPRPSAKAALPHLPYTVMLTGDNPAAAQAVAASLGVDEVRAGLLPQEKVAAVQQLSARHGVLAMVGDGVNDAPALAAADIGIAMGAAGTAQAMETADVVLMQDDLGQLVQALDLSRRTMRIIRQNVGLSFALKALFLLLTLPGFTTLWMAVLADVGMALLVTLNGLRLLRP